MTLLGSALLEYKLMEDELLEDKIVKFGGEVSPKFGWCIIYMGGGGSGKSTATNYLSRIQGKVFNVDEWKENSNRWKLTNPETGRPYEADFETPEEERTLDNSEFVSQLHNTFKPVTKKVKKGMLNNPASDPRRLPNMIFDMTGDSVNKIDEIVKAVKPQGYKVGIIWILNTFGKAWKNNAKRGRQVNSDVMYTKHRDVLATAEEIFSSGYIKSIDEFWVIDAFNPEGPQKGEDGKVTQDSAVKYHDEPNVYKIPTNENGLKEFEEVVEIIEATRNDIQNYKDLYL